MANILILGGGFGGLVAAEQLARTLKQDHQITVVSRDDKFVFYPDLVRVAFQKTKPADVVFDLRESLIDRRVRFIQGEVARVKPHSRTVLLARGEVVGELTYDYLVFALGRRLATEQIPGFFECAHHLLTVEAALKFGEAIRNFQKGRVVIGQCQAARLSVPVYETAFAISRYLRDKQMKDGVSITIVSPDSPSYQLGDAEIARALRSALDEHYIEFLPDFVVSSITKDRISSASGHAISYGLLMLVPPFQGSSATIGAGITDDESYIRVDKFMRVLGCENMYAVGDCVSLSGPKMAHMAVQQAEVAAANIALELSGTQPHVSYNHELMMVIDEGGPFTTYVEQNLDQDTQAIVSQGRFWSWAKWIHDRYWQSTHS